MNVLSVICFRSLNASPLDFLSYPDSVESNGLKAHKRRLIQIFEIFACQMFFRPQGFTKHFEFLFLYLAIPKYDDMVQQLLSCENVLCRTSNRISSCSTFICPKNEKHTQPEPKLALTPPAPNQCPKSTVKLCCRISLDQCLLNRAAVA